MMIDNFYVYLYLDQDNIPFYVGKGHGKRWKISQHMGNHISNLFLKRKILKVGPENIIVKFLFTNLPEDLAFEQEEYWISYYGRRDLGKGTLCNLTDGGEGDSGKIVSEVTRRKISKANKGLLIGEKNPMFGKKHTEQTRQQMHMHSFTKGKPRSKEIKEKISLTEKGRVIPEKQKRKISKTLKGYKHTEETKRKMGLSHKLFSRLQEIEIYKLYTNNKMSLRKLRIMFNCSQNAIRNVIKSYGVLRPYDRRAKNYS